MGNGADTGTKVEADAGEDAFWEELFELRKAILKLLDLVSVLVEDSWRPNPETRIERICQSN